MVAGKHRHHIRNCLSLTVIQKMIGELVSVMYQTCNLLLTLFCLFCTSVKSYLSGGRWKPSGRQSQHIPNYKLLIIDYLIQCRTVYRETCLTSMITKISKLQSPNNSNSEAEKYAWWPPDLTDSRTELSNVFPCDIYICYLFSNKIDVWYRLGKRLRV